MTVSMPLQVRSAPETDPEAPEHDPDDEGGDEPAKRNGESEKSEKDRPGDIQKSLFKARTVLIFGEINMKLAQSVTAQLLALDADDTKPIRLFINSPGGHVEAGDTIHDMVRFVASPVRIIGTGWVASAGAHIFLGAQRQNRYCLPNTRFMIHQPLGGMGGRATDIAIEAKEIIRMRERLNRIIARETGQPYERVAKDTDRNYWMSSEEARDYGLVTHVVERIDQLA